MPRRLDMREAGFEAAFEALLAAKRDARIGSWIEARRNTLLDAGELVVDLSPIRGS